MESAKKAPSVEATTGLAGKSPEEISEAIKAIAKNLRDSSMQIRETVRTLRKSGGLQEIGEAVSMAAMAARDTAKDISEAAKELQDKGIIDDTVNAIGETASTTRETVKQLKEQATRASGSLHGAKQNFKEAARDLKETGRTLKDSASQAYREGEKTQASDPSSRTAKKYSAGKPKSTAG